MLGEQLVDADLTWVLLYTKPQAEAWADVNLRKQGFHTLLPRYIGRRGAAPLFPRYVFAGHATTVAPRALAGTFGVQYVVKCGAEPARVTREVIGEIVSRMNANGIVHLDHVARPDPLFAKRERDRVHALLRLAEAGFRVKSA